jgi:hypothetical protein
VSTPVFGPSEYGKMLVALDELRERLDRLERELRSLRITLDSRTEQMA